MQALFESGAANSAESYDNQMQEIAAMTADPQNPQRGRVEDFGRKIDDHIQTALPQVEAEVRRIITYLNDEVVPQVRRNSSEALKAAAEQLAKLADSFERGNRPQPPTGGKR